MYSVVKKKNRKYFSKFTSIKRESSCPFVISCVEHFCYKKLHTNLKKLHVSYYPVYSKIRKNELWDVGSRNDSTRVANYFNVCIMTIARLNDTGRTNTRQSTRNDGTSALFVSLLDL